LEEAQRSAETQQTNGTAVLRCWVGGRALGGIRRALLVTKKSGSVMTGRKMDSKVVRHWDRKTVSALLNK